MARQSGDLYPVFRSLGARHEFLGEKEAAIASRDERIKSIWPFIVRRSKEFCATLTPRERVNFDPEDVLVEIWTALAERDELWTAERGKYITFAGTVIDHALCDIRDRSRTVESPRNSSCRMKEYIKEEESGTISPRRKKSADDIRRTGEAAQPIGVGRGEAVVLSRNGFEPTAILTRRESDKARKSALASAIRKLSPVEANIVGRLCGLWGRTPQSIFWVSWETGLDTSEVRAARSSAYRKIRDHLLLISHPAVSVEA